jgi:hypothetical protein
MKQAVTLGAVLLVMQATTAAQIRVVRSGDSRLVGISMVDVVVETRASPDAKSQRCLPPRDELGRLAVATLSAATLKATLSDRASSWFHTVYVLGHATRVDGTCVTALETDLRTAVNAIPDADTQRPSGQWGSLLRGDLSLTRDGVLVSSPPSDPSPLLDALRGQLTRIARRVAAANLQEK